MQRPFALVKLKRGLNLEGSRKKHSTLQLQICRYPQFCLDSAKLSH